MGIEQRPPQSPQEMGQEPQYSAPVPQPGMQYQPVSTPPVKKGFFRKKVGPIPLWVIILAVLIVIGVGANLSKGDNSTASNSNTNQNGSTTSIQSTTVPTTAPTPTPTRSLTWTTTQTFTGNGVKKTSVFTVGNDWKILWSCDPSSFFGGQYNLIVTVYNSDGTLADVGVNTICKAENTSDSTEEHQGGNIYLDVNSEGSWSLQVQELK